jgi:DNA polymerase bacteriophage-type
MSLRFNVVDLSAIETRVGAWLSGCTTLMDVFVPYTDVFGEYQRNGRDPYLAFACKMYACTYDPIYADYKGKNGKERKGAAKRKRQIAKPGVLGAIYRLSGGGWGWSRDSYKDHNEQCDAKMPGIGKKRCLCPEVRDKIKIGFWGYAEAMNVDITQEQAHEVVRIFRESYPEIPKFWRLLEEAVADVMHPDHLCTVRKVGPGGCVVIDRLNIEGRRPIMRMQLPSGRYLHYVDARLESTLMPWKGMDDDGNEINVYRDSLIYAGTNQKTKQWGIWVATHGGKLFENLTQAVARDILAVKLLEFEERGLEIVGHVHDEGIALVIDDLLSPTVEDMVDMMSKEVDWAPGLLLGADGFEDLFYHK